MRARSSRQSGRRCVLIISATASVDQSSKTSCSFLADRSGNTFAVYRARSGGPCQRSRSLTATFLSDWPDETVYLATLTTWCSAIQITQPTPVSLQPLIPLVLLRRRLFELVVSAGTMSPYETSFLQTALSRTAWQSPMSIARRSASQRHLPTVRLATT